MADRRPTRVEMVYDRDCPNVERARAAIRAALASMSAPLDWREWDRADPATPAPLRRLGSPSVLVDGRDVGGDGGSLAIADENSCRIYVDACGCTCGAPSTAVILAAMSLTGRGSQT
jgi:mercuric ion transport protein